MNEKALKFKCVYTLNQLIKECETSKLVICDAVDRKDEKEMLEIHGNVLRDLDNIVNEFRELKKFIKFDSVTENDLVREILEMIIGSNEDNKKYILSTVKFVNKNGVVSFTMGDLIIAKGYVSEVEFFHDSITCKLYFPSPVEARIFYSDIYAIRSTSGVSFYSKEIPKVDL